MINRRAFFKSAGMFVAGCAMAVQLARRPILAPLAEVPTLAVSDAPRNFAEILKLLKESTGEIQREFLRKRAQGIIDGKPYVVPPTDWSGWEGNQWS